MYVLNFVVGHQSFCSFDWFIEILAKEYGSFSPKISVVGGGGGGGGKIL